VGDISEAIRRAKLESDDPSGSWPLEIAESGLPVFPRGVTPLRAPAAAEPATIPRTRDAGWQARAVWVQQHGPVAEAFRHLALQVRKGLAARGASSVLVVSGVREEGKTLTACNLALALASLSAGERIALVELDLRLPNIARSLGIPCQVGFESVLAGDSPLEACRVPTEVPALDLYPVLYSVPNAHEWLTRPNVAAILRQLEHSYGTVVCDGPPALPVPDVELLAPHMGACLAVVRTGRTPRSGYRALVEMLPKGNLMGTFLNCARPPRHARGYHHHVDYHQLPAEESARGA
jgi:Mrp family chromosome partitioning ATPase